MWTCQKRLFNGINVNTIICIAYKSHYEALNIHRTASHKEVKDAYYRLSMIYHPDKNKGSEEAAKMFRDITSAYEVLGNVRQRRLYDDKAVKKEKTFQYSPKQPFDTMNSKSNMYKNNIHIKNYNFDEWTKAHYSNMFQQHRYNREMRTRFKTNENYSSRQHNYNLFSLMIFISIFILVSILDHIKMLINEHEKIKKFSVKRTTND